MPADAAAAAWLASDALLAAVLLGALAASAFVLRPMLPSGWPRLLALLTGRHVASSRAGPFALETAATAFAQYETLAGRETARMRDAYGRLGRAHKRVAGDIGYPAKLARLAEVTGVNARVTEGVAQLAGAEHGLNMSALRGPGASLSPGSLHRTREALRHFVRDWSDEGRAEREKIFGPILDVVKEFLQAQREDMQVLLPGSGLGRLAWEVSQLGTRI
jgi:hypothetical protein